MARITVEDCQRRVDNRFLLVQMAIKRVRQFREGYEPLVDSKTRKSSRPCAKSLRARCCLKTSASTPPWKAKPRLILTTKPCCTEHFHEQARLL